MIPSAKPRAISAKNAISEYQVTSFLPEVPRRRSLGAASRAGAAVRNVRRELVLAELPPPLSPAAPRAEVLPRDVRLLGEDGERLRPRVDVARHRRAALLAVGARALPPNCGCRSPPNSPPACG